MAKRQSEDMSRSEKIRTRNQKSRKDSQKRPFGHNATRKQTKHQVPITRRATSHAPVINHQRRKVHVPLKTKGAEVQLPAFPKLQLGWRFISGLVFIISLVVVISLSSSSMFEISTINLQGAQRLGSDMILAHVDLAGRSIISVHPAEIENLITESFPSLKQVSVSVGLPASVSIQVIERQPLILWQDNNSALWIDADGVMFPIRGEAEVSQTVIANGAPPEAPTAGEVESEEEIPGRLLLEEMTYPRTSPEFVQGLLSLNNYLPESSDLQYDPQFGLGWRDPNGWLVYFGRKTSNLDIKLAEYEAIITALQEDNITPALISIEFLRAPFMRLE
jgi:hypothetical protein